LGLGTFLDIHVLHWHGITAVMEGHRRDTIELFPATFHVADARMDDPGQWMLHCHVNIHFDGGMIAFFRIHKNEHAGVHGHGWAPANFSNVPARKALGPVPLSKVIAEASNIRLPDNSTKITSSTAKHGARNTTTVSNHGGSTKASNKTVWFGKPLPPALKIGVTKLKDHDLRGTAAGKTVRHESARQVAAKTARHESARQVAVKTARHP
ncbi:hephaestin-like 1, partial [Allomyces arbusculus]